MDKWCPKSLVQGWWNCSSLANLYSNWHTAIISSRMLYCFAPPFMICKIGLYNVKIARCYIFWRHEFWTRNHIQEESQSNLEMRRRAGLSIVHLSNRRTKSLFKVLLGNLLMICFKKFLLSSFMQNWILETSFSYCFLNIFFFLELLSYDNYPLLVFWLIFLLGLGFSCFTCIILYIEVMDAIIELKYLYQLAYAFCCHLQ